LTVCGVKTVDNMRVLQMSFAKDRDVVGYMSSDDICQRAWGSLESAGEPESSKSKGSLYRFPGG
jgi:hypothetical protein